MKLHHFRDVVAIAERGSLRAAARHLQLAQPALTRSLSELERELGAPLFDRQARGMTTTPIGEAFVHRATAILSEVRRAQDEVEQLRGGTQGTVTVGLSMAPHLSVLPRVLRPFRSRFPAIKLNVFEGSYATLETALRDGTMDFYVGPAPEGLTSEVLQEVLFRNARTILCRNGHPLIKATRLAELVDAEWATTSVTVRAEEELGALFESYGLPPPRLALRCRSALTIIVSLAYSDMLAMVPSAWVQFAPTAGALQTIDVQDALPAPPIVLVRRRGVPLTPAATYLLDLTRKALPEGSEGRKAKPLRATTPIEGVGKQLRRV